MCVCVYIRNMDDDDDNHKNVSMHTVVINIPILNGSLSTFPTLPAPSSISELEELPTVSDDIRFPMSKISDFVFASSMNNIHAIQVNANSVIDVDTIVQNTRFQSVCDCDKTSRLQFLTKVFFILTLTFVLMLICTIVMLQIPSHVIKDASGEPIKNIWIKFIFSFSYCGIIVMTIILAKARFQYPINLIAFCLYMTSCSFIMAFLIASSWEPETNSYEKKTHENPTMFSFGLTVLTSQICNVVFMACLTMYFAWAKKEFRFSLGLLSCFVVSGLVAAIVIFPFHWFTQIQNEKWFHWFISLVMYVVQCICNYNLKHGNMCPDRRTNNDFYWNYTEKKKLFDDIVHIVHKVYVSTVSTFKFAPSETDA